MMTLTPELLYKEVEGTLTPAEDPSQASAGSQADTYGYRIGTVPYAEILEKINKRQENGTGRPIEVNIRVPDKVGPGVVSESIFIQELLDAVDIQEWRDVQTTNGAMTREQADIRLFELRIIGAGLQQFEGAVPQGGLSIAITDGAQAQLLGIFDNTNWGATRDTMIDLLKRPGTRMEEMQGFAATDEALREANKWGVDNGRQSMFDFAG